MDNRLHPVYPQTGMVQSKQGSSYIPPTLNCAANIIGLYSRSETCIQVHVTLFSVELSVTRVVRSR